MVTTCEPQTMKCRPLLPPVISSQIKLNYCNGVSVLLTQVSRYAGLSLIPDDLFEGTISYKPRVLLTFTDAIPRALVVLK
jgi:hypothetical protein